MHAVRPFLSPVWPPPQDTMPWPWTSGTFEGGVYLTFMAFRQGRGDGPEKRLTREANIMYMIGGGMVVGQLQKMPVVSYQSAAGRTPVLDWLKGLPAEDRAIIGHDLIRVQFRWPVGMPLCRPMGDGLWEVRSSLPCNRIARLVFCQVEGRLVVLHGFMKKTQKTPDEDMDLARRRQREFDRQERTMTDAKTPRETDGFATLDGFLDAEGTREAFQAVAIKEVLAWQIDEAMKAQKLTRKALAERMGTSRSQVARLLDPKDGNVTLVTLQRAAAIVGRKVRLELV